MVTDFMQMLLLLCCSRPAVLSVCWQQLGAFLRLQPLTAAVADVFSATAVVGAGVAWGSRAAVAG
jgi:hypothetical protein